jgi:hypothetical protein
MRRLGVLLTVLALAAPQAAFGQGRVRLEITMSDPVNRQGARQPQVRSPGILRDARWRDALQNSFPLRMRFRVEIWRVRPDWFDALERSFEWETLVQLEPLTDQYSKTVIFGGSARGFARFASLQELERDLEVVQRVNITPAGIGEYYFTASLQVRTLTEAEMEELERFIQGEPSPAEVEDPRPSLGRTARRLLLRFGGLPYQELEARTGRFEVRAP